MVTQYYPTLDGYSEKSRVSCLTEGCKHRIEDKCHVKPVLVFVNTMMGGWLI